MENRHQGVVLSEKLWSKCVQTVLEILDHSHAEISVVFVDDEEISLLNRAYLDRDGPTNVIAFPMREGEASDVTPELLGDVVISLDTAIREAENAGIPWRERLLALLIHGLLHLLGYDHIDDVERGRQMEREEARVFELAVIGCSALE